MHPEPESQPLFATAQLEKHLEICKAKLGESVDDLPPSEILTGDLDVIAADIAKKHALEPIAFEYPRVEFSTGDGLPRAMGREWFPAPSLRVKFFVPFCGRAELLHCHPLMVPGDLGRSKVNAVIDRAGEIVLSYETTAPKPEDVRRKFAADFQEIEGMANLVSGELRLYNRDIAAEVVGHLGRRRAVLAAMSWGEEELGVPRRTGKGTS